MIRALLTAVFAALILSCSSSKEGGNDSDVITIPLGSDTTGAEANSFTEPPSAFVGEDGVSAKTTDSPSLLPNEERDVTYPGRKQTKKAPNR